MTKKNGKKRPIPLLRRNRADVWACLFLLLTVAGLFWPALQNEFVYFDDTLYVSENPMVTKGLTWEGAVYAWTTLYLANYTPLTWMSYQLDTTLFGTAPAGYIFTNLVFHAANCVLLYLFLRISTGRRDASFVAALLFAIHPLHVESVVWIAERKDVLSTFFLLLTLLVYLWYAQRPNWSRYLLVATSMALGLLSKPMLVTLPILLLLVDFWPLNRTSLLSPESTGVPSRKIFRLVLEKVPLLLMAFVFGIVTIIAQDQSGAMAGTGRFPPLFRVLNAITAIGWYLQKTFLPTELTAFYPVKTLETIGWDWVIPAVAIFLITVICLLLWRRQPWLIWGWLWFLIALLPVLGLMQVGMQAYADRYSYVPHIGLLTALCWLLFSIPDAWKFGPMVKWGTAIFFTTFLAFLTFFQISHWRNVPALWTHALEVNEANWRAHYQIGKYLHNNRYSGEALPHLLRARDLEPNVAVVQNSLGIVQQVLGKYDDAIQSYASALVLQPKNYATYLQLASVLTTKERFAEARAVLLKCQELYPAERDLELALGQLAVRQQKLTEAITHFEKAEQMLPGSTPPMVMKAACLMELGRKAEAIQTMQKVVEITPHDVAARLQLGDFYSKAGYLAAARDQFEQVLQLDPENTLAREKLQTLAVP